MLIQRVKTRVSETIRQLTLVKAQTTFKTQKYYIWRKKTIFYMADAIIVSPMHGLDKI